MECPQVTLGPSCRVKHFFATPPTSGSECGDAGRSMLQSGDFLSFCALLSLLDGATVFIICLLAKNRLKAASHSAGFFENLQKLSRSQWVRGAQQARVVLKRWASRGDKRLSKTGLPS